MVENFSAVENNSFDFLASRRLQDDFYRAIYKRLSRRGEEFLMEKVRKVDEIDTLDSILEALLEGKSQFHINSIISEI
ncbi:MAG: hypothetical protein JXR95_11020 [Deltaproteobacteria bacterium]|nr:hypothetical protein [Deltaproteobacteria bacterium]